MKVYIAASSADLERVDRCAAAASAAGIQIVSMWPITVRTVGHANPREASRADRQKWSLNCLADIQSCDAIWLLAPPPDKPTRGAWLELGYAIHSASECSFPEMYDDRPEPEPVVAFGGEGACVGCGQNIPRGAVVRRYEEGWAHDVCPPSRRDWL